MKKFKAKRKSKFKLLKIIFVIGICYFSFSYSLKLLINKKIKNKVTNKVIINYLLKTSSNNLVKLNKNNDLFNLNFNSSTILLKTGLNNMRR